MAFVWPKLVMLVIQLDLFDLKRRLIAQNDALDEPDHLHPEKNLAEPNLA